MALKQTVEATQRGQARLFVARTVSQILILVGFPSTVTTRDPYSTPIVTSWNFRNLLSVNCRSRHDFPTPVHARQIVSGNTARGNNRKISCEVRLTHVADDDALEVTDDVHC